MKEMNKQVEYGGYKFNIKIELDALLERHPGGRHQHRITVDDMGTGNYCVYYMIDNSKNLKHAIERILRKTEAWVENSEHDPVTVMLESMGFQKIQSEMSGTDETDSELSGTDETDPFVDVHVEKPNHKDLVICFDGDMCMPAIYYKSLGGFYHFSTFYHTNNDTTYHEARTKSKHRIHGITKWMIMPGTKEFMIT